jgi:tRNA(fMet)-specific endonuclease VapC
MSMYLLDSNTLIYSFKGQGRVREKLMAHSAKDVFLCTPVIWEILSGTLKSERPQGQLDSLRLLQQRYAMLDFDATAMREAASVRATLELAGQPIGTVDTLIAGIALANKLTLVTHNTREFSRVPGLSIDDWYE